MISVQREWYPVRGGSRPSAVVRFCSQQRRSMPQTGHVTATEQRLGIG
jgi:hypothetical protein